MCLFGWKSIYNLANHELRIAIYTPAYLNSRRRNGVTSFTETRNGKNVNQPLKHYRKLTYSLCFNIRKKTQWPSQARLRIAVFLRQQKAAELEGEEKCPDKSSPRDGDWRTTGVENEVIDGSAIDAPPSDFR